MSGKETHLAPKMDYYIVYTLDCDNKKTIWKQLYTKWEDATNDIEKAMEIRYRIYLKNFLESGAMLPKVNRVTPADAVDKKEGVFYSHAMNGSYRYYIMKLDA
jgi:hypothetical protein